MGGTGLSRRPKAKPQRGLLLAMYAGDLAEQGYAMCSANKHYMGEASVPNLHLCIELLGGQGLIDATGALAGAGLPQVYTEGGFGSVCGMNDNAADVVCGMLGYDRGFIECGSCST